MIVREPDAEWKCDWRGIAVLIDAAGKRCRKSWKNCNGDIQLGESGLVGKRWEALSTSDLIHGVDAVAAAALGDVKSVIVNCDAAEIIVLAGFVGSHESDLSYGKLSNLIDVRWDWRSHTGNEKFDTGGINQVESDLGGGNWLAERPPLLSLPAM